MAGVLQHLRSSTLNKRPNPASMVDGQVAINYASGSPGMFFKDSNGSLVKVGPVHVGSTAPNVSPASGGTAGNSLGEQWLDTSGGTYVFKIWDGGSWRSEAGEFVNSTGDTMTGSLTMGPSASLIFEGSADDGFETTLTVVNPTVDRTITLPNVTGTVITTGDTGTVTSTMLLDGTILNADVNASAAIAGTKISPDFGSQTITTTGIVSAALGAAAAPSITFTGDTNTGIYSPGADQLAISTGGSGRLFVDASGRLLVGTSSASTAATAVLQGNSGGSTSHAIINLARGVTNPGINLSLGFAQFQDAAGSVGAQIYAQTDAAWSAGSYAGRLVFSTTADGASSPTERMRIDSSGRVGIGVTTVGSPLHVKANSTEGIRIESPDFGGIYGLLTSRRSSGSPLDIAAIQTVGSLEPEITFSRSTNGTTFAESGRWDKNGRLLVGTSSSSAAAKLIVQGNTSDGAAGGLAQLQIGSTTPADAAVLGRLDFSDSAGYQGAWIRGERDGGTWTSGSSHPGRLVFSTTADGAASPTERMRITSGGALLANITSPFSGNSNTLNSVDSGVNSWAVIGRHAGASGTSRCILALAPSEDNLGGGVFFLGSSTGTDRFIVWTTGNVVNSNNSYGAISDIKLKENIVDANSQWDDVKALQVRNYNFKEGQTHTQIGLVAQEAELVSPGLVSESPDRDAEGNDLGTVTKSVNYSVLYMKAVKALQEAMERIETLEAKVAALEDV